MAAHSTFNLETKLQLLDEYPCILPAHVSHPPPPASPLTRCPGQFDSDRPYHLVGFGSGGAVATFYASHFSSPSLRSLILLNSFSYVDTHLAGVLHDCMNIFGCAPDSRPDLPVYFHARFLFSPAYLGQVCSSLVSVARIHLCGERGGEDAGVEKMRGSLGVQLFPRSRKNASLAQGVT